MVFSSVDECALGHHKCDNDPQGLAECMNLDHGVTCKCTCFMCERFGIFYDWRREECIIPAGKSKKSCFDHFVLSVENIRSYTSLRNKIIDL